MENKHEEDMVVCFLGRLYRHFCLRRTRPLSRLDFLGDFSHGLASGTVSKIL